MKNSFLNNNELDTWSFKNTHLYYYCFIKNDIKVIKQSVVDDSWDIKWLIILTLMLEDHNT